MFFFNELVDRFLKAVVIFKIIPKFLGPVGRPGIGTGQVGCRDVSQHDGGEDGVAARVAFSIRRWRAS